MFMLCGDPSCLRYADIRHVYVMRISRFRTTPFHQTLWYVSNFCIHTLKLGMGFCAYDNKTEFVKSYTLHVAKLEMPLLGLL